MVVEKIVDRELVIKIQDARIKEALAGMDINLDGQIDIEDFRPQKDICSPDACSRYEGISDETIRRIMLDKIIYTFTAQGMFSPIQHRAIADFFDLYNDVKTAQKLIGQWLSADHTSGHSSYYGTDSELEFDSGYWTSSVSPHFTGAGIFAGFKLQRRIYTVIMGLAGQDVKEDDIGLKRCGLASFAYSPKNLPQFIGAAVEDLVAVWSETIKELGKYHQIECEGKGCKSGHDEVEFLHLKITQKDLNGRVRCGE